MRRNTIGVAVAGIVVIAAGTAGLPGGDDRYRLKAQFEDAGGLREGFKVRIDGAPVGEIASLELNEEDRVVAELRLDGSGAPVGRDVRATARAADLLGEKYVDIDPGDVGDPAPSGTVIAPSRTDVSVELDDVLNAVDLPTREALRVFINEQGASVVGRGNDLAATLEALPGSLAETRRLLEEFARDNRALGRLIEESDRVVGEVARERDALGRLVGGFASTLNTLGGRSRALGETVRRAPATLASAQRALGALQGATAPLGPAARGLRRTAPHLTATLEQLPAFAEAAGPTLDTVRRVSPTLEELGRRGAPVVRRLQPLSTELDTFATALDPVSQTFDDGFADLLGVLEGWARATQPSDAASHVFRFGATVDATDLTGLLPPVRTAQDRSRPRRKPAPRESEHAQRPERRPDAPSRGTADGPDEVLRDTVTDVPGRLQPGARDDGGTERLLDYLLGP